MEKLVRSMEVIDELVMSVDDQEKVRGGQRSVKEKRRTLINLDSEPTTSETEG